jgi:hypothetical protein
VGEPFAAFKDFQVWGNNVGAYVDAFKQYPSVLAKCLIQQGILKGSERIGDLDRTAWYPMDAWLRTNHGLLVEVGANSVYASGKKIPEMAVLPPNINDVYSSLETLDVAYHMNHKKGGTVMFDAATGTTHEGIGHYATQRKQGEKAIVVVCDAPYPCDFDRGIVGGFAARFEPFARAVHEAGPCRKKGDASCTYVVRW